MKPIDLASMIVREVQDIEIRHCEDGETRWTIIELHSKCTFTDVESTTEIILFSRDKDAFNKLKANILTTELEDAIS